MNRNYQKGYRFERRIFSYFSNNGFYCVRSAGSHGVFDILAVYRGRIFGVQCKYDGRITKRERERITETAAEHEIIPLLAFVKNRRTWIKRLDTGDEYRINAFIADVKNGKI